MAKMVVTVLVLFHCTLWGDSCDFDPCSNPFYPLYTNGVFLPVSFNKLGTVHCTYLGVSVIILFIDSQVRIFKLRRTLCYEVCYIMF